MIAWFKDRPWVYPLANWLGRHPPIHKPLVKLLDWLDRFLNGPFYGPGGHGR